MLILIWIWIGIGIGFAMSRKIVTAESPHSTALTNLAATFLIGGVGGLIGEWFF